MGINTSFSLFFTNLGSIHIQAVMSIEHQEYFFGSLCKKKTHTHTQILSLENFHDILTYHWSKREIKDYPVYFFQIRLRLRTESTVIKYHHRIVSLSNILL